MQHVGFSETQELEHGSGKVDAANLRLGLFRSGAMGRGTPEANADAGLRASCATRTLIEDMRTYGLTWLFDECAEPIADSAPDQDREPAVAAA